jgi:hypothetical protein
MTLAMSFAILGTMWVIDFGSGWPGRKDYCHPAIFIDTEKDSGI